MNTGPEATCAALAALVVACAGCGGGVQELQRTAAEAPASSPAGPASLASVQAGPLAVEVLRVQRLSAHLVQVDLLVANGGDTPIDLRQALSSPAGGLDQSALTAASGDSRTFVVRDEHGKTQCSDDLGVLSPGARRGLFLRFIALSAGEFTGTLEIPGIAPLPALPVPAAAVSPAGGPLP
jgi:hypothetical protein